MLTLHEIVVLLTVGVLLVVLASLLRTTRRQISQGSRSQDNYGPKFN
jgi:hypothetical protein